MVVGAYTILVFDLHWWPLIRTKNNRAHVLMMSTHTNYELNWSLPFQIMMITRFSLLDLRDLVWAQVKFALSSYSGYQVFTLWPLATSTKSNRVCLLAMMNTHTEYKLNWSLSYLVMVIKVFHCLNFVDHRCFWPKTIGTVSSSHSGQCTSLNCFTVWILLTSDAFDQKQ